GISEFINSYSGYSKFSFVDFDQDGIKDLILYGNNQKNFVLHRGLKDSTFSKPVRKFFFFPIDDFKWLTRTKSGTDYYIFISRNKRLTGLVSFTSSYSLQLLNSIEFNSYPSSIKIVDLDKNGKNEALIFGNNFNGIQQIANNGYRLENFELNNENVFSDLVITDFNQDDLEDLIAIDVIKNSVSFLENNEFSGFTGIREIEFEESLYSIESLDYNNDSFNDLIIAKENGLEILLGDSVYSFTKRTEFVTPFTSSQFIIDDIYKDSNFDLVMLNSLYDQLVIYSNMFKPKSPINIEFNGISFISTLKKKNSNSLIVLSKKGRILCLTSIKKKKKPFSFIVGGIPNNLVYLSWKDSLYSKIFISNSKDNSITVVKYDSSENFTELENKTILNSYSKFTVSPSGNLIACYSVNNRLIEITPIISDNFNSTNPEFVYASYEIDDLIIDNQNSVQVLELFEKELFHETIINKNGRYLSKEIFSIDTQVVKTKMLKNGEIFYWTQNSNVFEFKQSVLGNPKLLLKTTSENSLNNSIKILAENSGKSDLITIISDESNEKIFILNGTKVQQYKSKRRFFTGNTSNDNIIKYYNFGSRNKMILIYNELQRSIIQLAVDENAKMIIMRKTIEDIDLNDYFVHRFDGKMYLIYSDKNKNCLTFKVLD
ncbi:MAG: hypothetical protein OQJ81_10740, partial [Melioribacteraceae bacterium]|nr:hypothetical protein [Melioribacteraceae bacterium]